MVRKIAIVLLGCWALNVQALPVVFDSTQYETSAAAIAGAAADADFDSSPPSALPLLTSVVALEGDDFASGSGIAGEGLLSTLAEASSVLSSTSGFGTAGFFGNFTGGGLFTVGLDFFTQDSTDVAAFSMGSLSLLLLLDNSIPVLDEVILTTGLHNFSAFIPSGSYSLQLLLSSEASASPGFNAQNFAQVTFNAALESVLIPEPQTSHLLLGGLLLLIAWSSRRHRAPNGQRAAP